MQSIQEQGAQQCRPALGQDFVRCTWVLRLRDQGEPVRSGRGTFLSCADSKSNGRRVGRSVWLVACVFGVSGVVCFMQGETSPPWRVSPFIL